MGKPVVRNGDKNSAGGKAISQDKTFIVDNKWVVTVGSPVTPHRPCPKKKKHCNAKTSQGTNSFIVNGKKVNIIGNKDTCGHLRVEGSKSMILES